MRRLAWRQCRSGPIRCSTGALWRGCIAKPRLCFPHAKRGGRSEHCKVIHRRHSVTLAAPAGSGLGEGWGALLHSLRELCRQDQPPHGRLVERGYRPPAAWPGPCVGLRRGGFGQRRGVNALLTRHPTRHLLHWWRSRHASHAVCRKFTSNLQAVRIIMVTGRRKCRRQLLRQRPPFGQHREQVQPVTPQLSSAAALGVAGAARCGELATALPELHPSRCHAATHLAPTWASAAISRLKMPQGSWCCATA